MIMTSIPHRWERSIRPEGARCSSRPRRFLAAGCRLSAAAQPVGAGPSRARQDAKRRENADAGYPQGRSPEGVAPKASAAKDHSRARQDAKRRENTDAKRRGNMDVERLTERS